MKRSDKQIVVNIDEETLKAFESLPCSGPNMKSKDWSPEEDELLRRFWPVKKHTEVARLLKMSSTTALKRYRKLTEEGNEDE